LGKPAYSAIPFTLPYYDKSSPQYAPKYNPTDARRILSADHITGPFTILTFTDPASATAAELIQAELAAVGVKATVETKAVADYIPAAAKGEFDLNYLGWSWPDADAVYPLFHSSQETGTGLNFTFLKSATLDSLIVGGRQQTNPKKAAVIYAELQKFMNQNVIIDPLWTDLSIRAARSRVHGWHGSITSYLNWQDMYVK
jgi:peptide/nickel transport system substrate-binding protein